MEMKTKIFDNTVITAFLKEIESVDVFKIAVENYNVLISVEVFEEFKNGFDKNFFEKHIPFFKVKDLREDSFYNSLFDYFSERYPFLHSGEVSSFLLALLEYHLKNKEYYFITDDNKMRKTIRKLSDDKLFYSKFKIFINSFNITGTIGLLKHFCNKNFIDKNSIKKIILDLKKSTFFVTEDLLKNLEEC